MLKAANISAKGIIFGIGFYAIASIVLSIVVGVAFSSITGISIKSPTEYQRALESSFDVRLVFMIGGLLIAFGMGYVAERFARVPSITNASICGVILLLYGITFVYLKPEAAPLWSQITTLVGVLPLAILGGRLGAGKKHA